MHVTWGFITPPPPLPKSHLQMLMIFNICCINTIALLSLSGGGVGVRRWGEYFWDWGHCLNNTLFSYHPFPSHYQFSGPLPTCTSQVKILLQILISGSVWGNPNQDNKYLLLLKELLSSVDSGYMFRKKAEEETVQHSFMEGGKLVQQQRGEASTS